MGIQRTLRAAAAVVAAMTTTAGLGAVAPAHADTQAKKDPARDVGITDKAAPKPAGIDIISSRNTYEGSTLTMSLRTIKLLKKGYTANWTITVPGSDTFYRLRYDHTGQQPKVRFFTFDGGPGTPGCQAAAAVAQGDTVVGRVPRGCIGGANQVRVATYTLRPIPASDSSRIDDARQDGWASEQLHFGPILARG